jgi:hypothetical protein
MKTEMGELQGTVERLTAQNFALERQMKMQMKQTAAVLKALEKQ